MRRSLRTLMSCLVVLGLHGGAPASADPATMSAAPGQPVEVERPRLTTGKEVRRSNDSHTEYVGAAVVVLVAMVWWNRRRRERFEDVDRGPAEARAAPPAEPGQPAQQDDDADELRAAARGEERPGPREARRARETR